MIGAIWKFPLTEADYQNINVDYPLHPMYVGVQDGDIFLWALARTEETGKPTRLEINIRGTGHPITGIEGFYLGTVQLYSGRIVLHVFGNIERLQEVI